MISRGKPKGGGVFICFQTAGTQVTSCCYVLLMQTFQFKFNKIKSLALPDCLSKLCSSQLTGKSKFRIHCLYMFERTTL
jgi:hypothetical protein